MTPLEAAQIVERSSSPRELPMDAGMYEADGTVPVTRLTPKQYDEALKVLDSRDRARKLHEARRG